MTQDLVDLSQQITAISRVIIVWKLDLQARHCVTVSYISCSITYHEWNWMNRARAREKMNAKMSRQEKWLSIQSWYRESLPKILAVIYGGVEYVRFFLESKYCPLSFMAIRMQHGPEHHTLSLSHSVKHYFKDHQRKHLDYSDVFATLRHTTVWVLQLQSGNAKLGWTPGRLRKQDEKKSFFVVLKTRPDSNDYPQCFAWG